jgi:hypothetical protein
LISLRNRSSTPIANFTLQRFLQLKFSASFIFIKKHINKYGDVEYVRKAKGKVKSCATLILRYYVLCFRDYLRKVSNCSHFDICHITSSSDEVLLSRPVKNKHIKLAVCC